MTPKAWTKIQLAGLRDLPAGKMRRTLAVHCSNYKQQMSCTEEGGGGGCRRTATSRCSPPTRTSTWTTLVPWHFLCTASPSPLLFTPHFLFCFCYYDYYDGATSQSRIIQKLIFCPLFLFAAAAAAAPVKKWLDVFCSSDSSRCSCCPTFLFLSLSLSPDCPAGV